MDRTKQFEKAEESEVWNAIAAFEQILEAIPDDRTALETLYEAYDHIGDKPRALDYLVVLGDAVADEQDAVAAKWVLEGLNRLGKNHPEAQRVKERVQALVGTAGVGEMKTAGAFGGAGTPSTAGNADITQELSLAWTLSQVGEISADEYSMIVQDLTENSTKEIFSPVSVLHVLYDRTFKQLEHIMAFLGRDSGLPIISLSSFDIQPEASNLLPRHFLVKRGAIVFSLMGQDALVGVLNPYDKALQEDVAGATNRTCHFYIVRANEYDAALEQTASAREPALA